MVALRFNFVIDLEEMPSSNEGTGNSVSSLKILKTVSNDAFGPRQSVSNPKIGILWHLRPTTVSLRPPNWYPLVPSAHHNQSPPPKLGSFGAFGANIFVTKQPILAPSAPGFCLREENRSSAPSAPDFGLRVENRSPAPTAHDSGGFPPLG